MPLAQSRRREGKETIGSGDGGEGESRSSKAWSLVRRNGISFWDLQALWK